MGATVAALCRLRRAGMSPTGRVGFADGGDGLGSGDAGGLLGRLTWLTTSVFYTERVADR